MATATLTLGSQNRWLADGTTTIWNFNFVGGYLGKDTVRAYYMSNDVVPIRTDLAITDANFTGAYQLSITPAVPNGYELVIYRDSKNGGFPRSDFTDGGGVTEENLDALARQAVFVAQEMEDFLGTATEASIALALSRVAYGVGAAGAAEDAAAASASDALSSKIAAAASAAAAVVSAAAAELSAANAAVFPGILASTVAGEGAAVVGLPDVSDNWASTTLDAALGEVASRIGQIAILVTEPRFGAVGNGVANDSPALLLAKAYAIAHLPCRIVFPSGTYKLDSSTGNWAYKGLTLEGTGSRSSIIKFTYSGQAFLIDAFQPGFTGNDATAPFIYRMNVRRLVFEGNSATTDIVFGRGIAQSLWIDILAREAHTTTGIGFNLQGVMLNTFVQVACSVNQDAMSSIPHNGLRLGAGTRNGASVGNSTNNTFLNLYCEGNVIGLWLTGADQNTFISGAPEACTQYGCLIAGISKMNTFIGVGFENPAASTASCADGGQGNRFINCYNNAKHDCQGNMSELRGGYYQLINVNGATAKYNGIVGVTVNHWGAGAGFTDTGTATTWKDIYNDVTAALMYPYKARTSITVTASPFQFTNNTGRLVEVAVQTGTLTQVRRIMNGDSFLCPISTPNVYLLRPTEVLELSYSILPGASYIQHNSL